MTGAGDDKEGLSILVKQRLSRPSFTRAISSEFTTTREEVESSRRAILDILNTLKVPLQVKQCINHFQLQFVLLATCMKTEGNSMLQNN